MNSENNQSNISLLNNHNLSVIVKNECLKYWTQNILNDAEFNYYRVSVEKNKNKYFPCFDLIEKNEKLFNENPEEKKKAYDRMNGYSISDKPLSYYNSKIADDEISVITCSNFGTNEIKIQKQESLNEEISNNSIVEESFN